MRLMGCQRPKLSSDGQRRLCSDLPNTQADMSLCRAPTPFLSGFRALAKLLLKKRYTLHCACVRLNYIFNKKRRVCSLSAAA